MAIDDDASDVPDARGGVRLRKLLGETLALPAAERARRLAELDALDPGLAAALRARLAERPGAGDVSTRAIALPAAGRAETVVPGLVSEDDDAGSQARAEGATATAFPAGLVLARRYRILALLGRGGMGEVYAAEDRVLGITVALKALRSHLIASGLAQSRFRREVLLARSVSHPNVCRIYDLGVDEGHGRPLPFLTMERIEGESLLARIRRLGPLSGDEAAALLAQLAAGLGAAHRAGVVHRDFTSGNVLLAAAPGGVRAVITDFGLAQEVSAGDAEAELTAAGRIAGTPAYMAPEQVRGETVGPAADIYALGVVLFEMLSGALPFTGDSPLAMAARRLVEPPRPLASLRPDLAPGWEAVIRGCLAMDPRRRFASAAEVVAALAANDVSRTTPLDLPLPARVSRLPEPITSFVGRERELAEVERLLTGSRLVTLAGAGGCGKTRLALEVARRRRDRQDGDVYLAELAPVRDPERLLEAVAAAVGVSADPGATLAAVLDAALALRPALLVLDNCEHLVDAAARLAAGLLAACPRLRILATSREPLAIAGEALHRLPPLDLPADEEAPLEELARVEGVRLLIERARSAAPAFRLTAENRAAVARCVRRLDGIPLALELAAARLRTLPLEQLLKRLDERFSLLRAGRRTGLAHHQTLEAAMAWSWDLLDADERALLRCLAVFAGGFGLEDAEQVIGGVAVAPPVLDVLTRLVEKSLVVYEERRGEARYRLLETVRQYARLRLVEAGEEDDACSRHLDSLLALARSVEPNVTGRTQSEWLDRLEDQHANLRVALAWAAAVSERCDRGLALATALRLFWDLRGHLAEGREHLDALLARQPSEGPGSDRAGRAAALCVAGTLAHRQGDAAASLACYREAVALSEAAGDRAGVGSALHGVGMALASQGDGDAAREAYEASLAIHREVGDRYAEARVLVSLGIGAINRADLAAARTLYGQAIAIFRALGDPWRAADALNNLANVAYDEGDYPRARSLHEEALALRREVGNLFGIAASLDNLGNVADAEGDYGRALPLHEEALAIRRRIGDRVGMAIGLCNLAANAERQGDAARSGKLYRQAAEIARRSGDRFVAVPALEGLARVAAALGDWVRATRLEAAARRLREAGGWRLAASDEKPLQEAKAAARAALGEAAFAAAQADGGGMAFDEVLRLAVGDER